MAFRPRPRVIPEFFWSKAFGCWPAEGAICNETLKLLNDYGFKWAASGQQVLQHNVNVDDGSILDQLYHPYSFLEQNLYERLSDLIGFTYQDWRGDHAVENLIHELEDISQKYAGTKGKVESIILDCENCWENYPYNGYYFMSVI